MKIKVLNKLLQSLKKDIEKALITRKNIEVKIESIESAIKSLKEALKNEKEIASRFPETSHAFAKYYKQFQYRMNVLVEEKQIEENKYQKIQKKIHDFFLDQKRYEKLIDQVKELKLQKEKKLETKILDELSLRHALE